VPEADAIDGALCAIGLVFMAAESCIRTRIIRARILVVALPARPSASVAPAFLPPALWLAALVNVAGFAGRAAGITASGNLSLALALTGLGALLVRTAVPA
jgi:hypothetical protein